MNLKDTIQQHNAEQEFKDDIFTIEYDNNGSHAALIKEIKAINSDNSFPFKVQLTDNNSIQYSYVGDKDTATISVKDAISYIDELRQTLIEMDGTNKIGHIAKVSDDDDSETIYIDGLNAKDSMTINVTKRI